MIARAKLGRRRSQSSGLKPGCCPVHQARRREQYYSLTRVVTGPAQSLSPDIRRHSLILCPNLFCDAAFVYRSTAHGFFACGGIMQRFDGHESFAQDGTLNPRASLQAQDHDNQRPKSQAAVCGLSSHFSISFAMIGGSGELPLHGFAVPLAPAFVSSLRSQTKARRVAR